MEEIANAGGEALTAPVPVTDYMEFAPCAIPVAKRRKRDVGDIYINQVRHTSYGWYIRRWLLVTDLRVVAC